MAKFDGADLPHLYRAADTASRGAQFWFILFVGLDLALIVIAALTSAISSDNPIIKFRLIATCAVATGVGLVLTIAIRSKNFEQNWYDGRAVAESIKTRSWRFMMRAEPYDIEDVEASHLFIKNLKEVLAERKRLSRDLIPLGNDKHITDKMRSVRNMDFENRKAFYLDERILDQQSWYAAKAALNKRRGNYFFGAIVTVQLLILLSSFYLLVFPETQIHFISLFSAMAAALIAWLQLKRHQELATSYALAAQELSFVAEIWASVEGEENMSYLVLDAENAISREHTLWVARRDRV
jgi:hypothetical protein